MENKVVVELKNEDMAALYRYIVNLDTSSVFENIKKMGLFVLIFFAILFLLNFNDLSKNPSLYIYIVLFVLAVALLNVFPLLFHKIMRGFNDRSIMNKTPKELQIEGTKQYILKKNCLEIRSVYGDLDIKPSELEDFRTDDNYLYIKGIEGRGAHVVPLRFFLSDEQKENFLDGLSCLKAGFNPGEKSVLPISSEDKKEKE